MSGVILGTLGLVIGIGMWVTFLFDVASESDTATSRLRPGQCLDAPVDAESARVVSCDAFHRFEVLAVLNDPTLPPEYPGREALAERARNRCSRLVAEYLGRPEDSSHLSLRAVVPTPEQWGRGDRWSACLLERADGEDLDAPLRNLTWPPGG